MVCFYMFINYGFYNISIAEFLFLSTYLPMSVGLSLATATNEGTDDKLQDFIEECKSILARFERSGYFQNL